ncbi:hypothetical protein Ancab_031178 [Ancistrocladus abbreviatus]
MFDAINNAILALASADPKMFILLRDQILEKLFTCSQSLCSKCSAELAILVSNRLNGNCTHKEAESNVILNANPHSNNRFRIDCNHPTICHEETQLLIDRAEEGSLIVKARHEVEEECHFVKNNQIGKCVCKEACGLAGKVQDEIQNVKENQSSNYIYQETCTTSTNAVQKAVRVVKENHIGVCSCEEVQAWSGNAEEQIQNVENSHIGNFILQEAQVFAHQAYKENVPGDHVGSCDPEEAHAESNEIEEGQIVEENHIIDTGYKEGWAITNAAQKEKQNARDNQMGNHRCKEALPFSLGVKEWNAIVNEVLKIKKVIDHGTMAETSDCRATADTWVEAQEAVQAAEGSSNLGNHVFFEDDEELTFHCNEPSGFGACTSLDLLPDLNQQGCFRILPSNVNQQPFLQEENVRMENFPVKGLKKSNESEPETRKLEEKTEGSVPTCQ